MVTQQRGRNAQVDLLKGIAIFFVIFFHCFYHTPDALLQPVRNVYLHIFFFIAGLFFSLKSGFGAFLSNKSRRLLLPYGFFVVLSAVVFLVCPWSWTYIYDSNSSVATNVFNFIFDPRDQPVWFVMSLFWLSIFYYLCKRYVPSMLLRAVVVIVLAIPGYFLSAEYYGALSYASRMSLLPELCVRLFYKMHIPVALTMLPYIYLGDLAARRGLLSLRLRGRRRWMPMAAAALVWVAASQTSDVSLYYYFLGNSVLLNNLASLAGIVFLWLAVQNIGRRVPLFSYLGRYSLVALGTHYVVLELLLATGLEGSMLFFVIDLALTLPAMWLVIRYFPRFVALKS